jgi:hypothetical protein
MKRFYRAGHTRNAGTPKKLALFNDSIEIVAIFAKEDPEVYSQRIWVGNDLWRSRRGGSCYLSHIIGPGLTCILTRAITHTFAPHDMSTLLYPLLYPIRCAILKRVMQWGPNSLMLRAKRGSKTSLLSLL